MSKSFAEKWHNFTLAIRSWRTASVTLLSFSSGLPLGLVWIAIPDWMRSTGSDIRVVGLFTLAQAPWTFKLLWSPLMDRYYPNFLGPRRSWILITQVALALLLLLLAGLGNDPNTFWIVGSLAVAIAIASASQDIALDGYTVEVLEKEEQAVAVGARIAMYRAAMYVAGALSISLAAKISWPAVNVMLAAIYLPMMYITLKAPKPKHQSLTPKTLTDAVWKPFLGMLSRPRAIEILMFVILYKLSDNFGQALLRPFLVDMGYSSMDRGVALGTIGLATTLSGAFFGGALTNFFGLGRSLWIFGFIQIFSNIGYIILSKVDVNRWLMFGSMGFESFTQGLGTGAFSVLLLRLTQKRFSVTQYAIFSSLFAIPRIISGPISGVMVDAMGWTNFFWLSMVVGIPGLLMLQRFCSWKDQEVSVDSMGSSKTEIDWKAIQIKWVDYYAFVGIFVASFMVCFLSMVALAILKSTRLGGPVLTFSDAVVDYFSFATVSDIVSIAGVCMSALVAALFIMSAVVARRSTQAAQA